MGIDPNVLVAGGLGLIIIGSIAYRLRWRTVYEDKEAGHIDQVRSIGPLTQTRVLKNGRDMGPAADSNMVVEKARRR